MTQRERDIADLDAALRKIKAGRDREVIWPLLRATINRLAEAV